MDEPARPRPGRANDADYRGGLFPLPVGPEGGPRPRRQSSLAGPSGSFEGDRKTFIEDVRQALYASKICSYAQGFVQLDAAAKEFGWKLNNGQIALLGAAAASSAPAFWKTSKRPSKESQPGKPAAGGIFRQALEKAQPSWRRVVRTAVDLGLPVPGFAAGSGLLRRLPPRPPAGQFTASPARLLRRPHLSTHRQAGHIPHGLDPRTQVAVNWLRGGWGRPAAVVAPSPGLRPPSPVGEGWGEGLGGHP